ncbi:MAG: methyl-accepting chemotaxis protein [Lachnospiraceae bacterium]|nr:methyl-accepting chemotaxis protein [Lachnospiraceae bacterium]
MAIVYILLQKEYMYVYNYFIREYGGITDMEEKAKHSIRMTMLMVALVPLLIMAVATTVIASFSLKSSITAEVKDDLSDLAHTMANMYDKDFEGDFVLREDGKLFKGESELTGNYELFDINHDKTGTDFTLFFGDTRYVTSLKDVDTGERIIGTKAGDAVIAACLKGGNDYFAENITINKTPYFGYYTPLKNADGSIVGMMFTGKPSTEVNKTISGTITSLVIIAVVLFIVSIVGILLLVSRMAGAMKSVTSSLAVIAAGRLNEPVEAKPQKRSDEIGLIARSTEKLRSSLSVIISEIAQHTGQLNDSVADIDNIATVSRDSTGAVNQAMDELANATMHNAENTQNANMRMNEMSTLIENIANDVDSLAENASSMGAIEKSAGQNLDEVTDYIEVTMEAFEKLSHQAELTNEAAQKIGAAVNIIAAIAEETTLLSLNASIESARAGEMGRGFGVVASQIQKLADQSSESAADIERSISELLAESSKTVEVMSDVKETVNRQKNKIEETQGNFDILAKNVSESVESINEIRGIAGNLRDLRGQMSDIIQELSALSEENAASTEETTATIGELDSTIANMATNSKALSDISSNLRARVSEFQV